MRPRVLSPKQPIPLPVAQQHFLREGGSLSLGNPALNKRSKMESLRAIFVKPDPAAQLRKCNLILRQNMRKLDRDIAAVRQAEVKTKNLILEADRRAARDPSRAKQAHKDVRMFARELIQHRKTSARLVTAKAQLSSVQMQVNETFAVRKIEGSIRASVGIMKDVNTLVRLPELAGTMQELSMELMKAGVIEEMVDETLPQDDVLLDEDDEAEGEVDKVLGEILKGKMDKTGAMPAAPPQQQVEEPQPVEEEDEEDMEATMDQMRNRLEALRS